MVLRLLIALACAELVACGDVTRLPSQADEGPNPTLASPAWSLIPTINVASAQGWPEGAMPTAPVGFMSCPFLHIGVSRGEPVMGPPSRRGKPERIHGA